MKTNVNIWCAPIAQVIVAIVVSSVCVNAIQQTKSQTITGQQQQQHSSSSQQAAQQHANSQNEATAQQQALERQSARLSRLSSGAPMDSSSVQHQAATIAIKKPSNNKIGDNQWRIPEHLMKQLLSESQKSGDDSLRASLDDDDDDASDERQASAGAGSSLAPTTAAANAPRDLKSAAGYQYPASIGHHNRYGDAGHHSMGHYDHGHGSNYGHGEQHYGSPSGYGGHGAGGYAGGKYYQYASVPYPYAWDFGYRRGNPYHTIERQEHGKGSHFNTKVKWSDKYGGYGVSVWDYNHDDHHGYGHGGYGNDHYGNDHYSGHSGAGAHHGGAHYGKGYSGGHH